MRPPQFTKDEVDGLVALHTNFAALGALFRDDEGTPQALRMIVGSLRESAEMLEGVAKRWESELDGD